MRLFRVSNFRFDCSLHVCFPVNGVHVNLLETKPIIVLHIAFCQLKGTPATSRMHLVYYNVSR